MPEKAAIDAEVARLTRLQGQHRDLQFKLRSQIRHHTDDLPRLERRASGIHEDLATRQDTRGDRFVIKLDGQEIRDRGIAGELILRRAERIRGSGGEREIGTFAGFQLFVADTLMRGPEVMLRAAGTHVAKVTDTALGTIRSVEYAIQN